ncbi:MAG: chain length-determining protein [Burkholderiales bacterium]|nr:chain length-determining protein [Burkholderiales bacterium]
MEQLIAQVLTIVRGMWRFRWPALAVAWVVGIVAVIIVFKIPDKYEASARIYVDTQSILKPLMAGLAVQPNVEQQITMLSRTLISRPNMEKLVRMADLDLKAQSKAEQEVLITTLMSSLQIKEVGRENLYTLAYSDAEPAKAQRVIQSLVSIFVESSLGATRKDTETARVFLNDQIKSYEARLEEAEAKLKEFRLRNLQMQAGDGKDSASRLAELGEQLNQAKLALREAEQARDAARQQLQNEKSQSANLVTNSLLQESAVNVATPEIDGRLDAQKRSLDNLLQRYTEQHPDVISTRRLIKDLEDQKAKEVKELRRIAMAAQVGASGVMSSAGSSLAYQELSRMLAASEVQVASLRARVAEFQARFDNAREMLKTAPQIEAEAAQLNRDYAIHKKNYEDLVARRESAAMSGELEVASGVADFRLIDPPRVSPQPVSPNRLLLLPLAFVVALGSGLFTAFAGSQLRPVFHSAAELREKISIPLLGVVSRVASAAEVRAERVNFIRFLAGSSGLIGLFVLTFIAVTIMAARRAG